MSVESVCNAIQDLVVASTRITSAPHIDAWPEAIDERDLPLALTRPGPGTWPHECLADVWSRRTYETEVYVLPIALGYYHEGVVATLAIIDDLGGRLTASSSGFALGGVVIDSEPRDQGLVILTYGGVQYRGTVFEIETIEDV